MGESQLKNAPTGWNHFIFTWRGPPLDTGGAPNKHCQTIGLLLFDGKKFITAQVDGLKAED
jgi:hypothetical protein